MGTKLLNSSQKLRGGYYTPSSLAVAISKWAIAQPNSTVLEPSFGDGEFLKAAISTKISLGATISQINETVTGTEIDDTEFKKVLDYFYDSFGVKLNGLSNSDFFNWCQTNETQFDVVLGNPPFIRYQNFPEPSRTKAMHLSKKNGVLLNKLTNIWVPFLVLSTAFLKNNGRLGMVIPAELLQVSYAGPLRKFLIDSFRNITIITCNELLFDDAEQEVVILLAAGKNGLESALGNIEVITTATKAELIQEIGNYKTSRQEKNVIHSNEKWTKYFLEQDEIDFIRSLRNDQRVVEFSSYFEVDVGVVTGKNDFFIVNMETAKEFNLGRYVRPAIGRSYQLKDEILSVADWEVHWRNGEAVGLLDFSSLDEKVDRDILRYLESGVARGVHEGYKCSIRKDWYKVPSIWIPDAFMFRQIHDFPHLVLNQANAVSTDTIHRVRKIKDKSFPQVLFYTYLTAASAEIEGRSYGGGVLELEPTEAERLLIPNPELVDVDKLNYAVSRKENGKFLKKNSDFVLREILSFSTEELSLLESIYKKLFLRRNSRKKINRGGGAPYSGQGIFPQLP